MIRPTVYFPSSSGRIQSLLREQALNADHKPWGRIGFALAIIVVIFLTIISRLGWLMLKDHSFHPLRQSSLTNPTNRANIIDRNGEILATNLITFSMFANGKIILDPQDAAKKLAQLFPDLQEKGLYEKFKSKKSFIWLKRNLTPAQQQAVNALGLVGIEFKKEQKRIYPHGHTTSHILGYTNIDNKGLAGIERAYNEGLTQQPTPLQLSLDLRIQHILHDELKASISEFHAKRGNGIIMNIHTGEILAMASLPDFDPHNLNPKKDDIFNANTLGVYEVGSIFKVFTFAMALDAKKISLSERFDASRPLMIGKHTIKDYKAQNRWLSAPEVFIYSSNIGTVKMALKMGPQAQRNFFDRLGFLKPLKTELKENAIPMAPRQWKEINAVTISYGYGLAISPLHLISGLASMVNGGLLVSPTLFVNGNKDKTPSRIISPSTSQAIGRLMHLVVKQGSGKLADAVGYVVGGKTGSANKQSAPGQGYVAKNKHRASFVFVFPMHNPQYMGLLTLDEPQGNETTGWNSTGGWVAAPTARKIIEKIAPLLNVAPVDETTPQIQMAMHLPSYNRELQHATR